MNNNNNKKLVFSNNLRNQMLVGVKTLANAVAVTLGPKGRNVILGRHNGIPVITKDGVSVAKEIFLEDEIQNIGAQIVKEASSKTADKAGDGTTTSTVLANSIIELGIEHVNKGKNAVEIKRGIDKATSVVEKMLSKMSNECKSKEDIIRVGTISANGDRYIGELIADAVEKVSIDGVITVETGKSINDILSVKEGMIFDKGYLSYEFVNDLKNQITSFENCKIFLTDKKLYKAKDLLNLLTLANKEQFSLLIIADDIEGEALSTLISNNIRKTIKVVAVKIPGFGDIKNYNLEDISILTNSKIFSDSTGLDINQVKLEHLGFAKKVIVSKEETTIIDGAGDSNLIKDRVESIRKLIDTLTVPLELYLHRSRLAKLTGGIAVIDVGGSTEVEIKEKQDRIEDALFATKAAVFEGIVPGGGIALLNAYLKIKNNKEKITKDLNLIGDQIFGFDVLIESLLSPIKQILDNAGLDKDLIISQLSTSKGDCKNNKKLNIGYDAYLEKYVDMVKSGIIDPVKVTRNALLNASSCAGLLLTSECAIYHPLKNTTEDVDIEDVIKTGLN